MSGGGAVVVWLAAAVLTAAFGGVQPQWYLPVFAALLAAAAVGLIYGNAGDGFGSGALSWLLLAALALPLAQMALGRSAAAAATEQAWVMLLATVAAFWLARRTPWTAWTSCRILAIGGAALAAWAMVQLRMFPGLIWGVHPVAAGAPVGPFVNHDDFAACMELLLPAGLALSLRPGQALARGLAWGLAPALMAAAVVASASRGGAAVATGEIVVFLWWWAGRGAGARAGWRNESDGGEGAERGRARRGAWAAMAGVAVLAAGYAAAAGFGPLFARLRRTELDAGTRLALARSSLEMGAARPWWGWGLGTWPAVYPAYARFDDGLRFNAAHDEYAQLWAETGALGCALALGVAVAYGRGVLAREPRRDGGARGAKAAARFAPLLAMGGFLAHATIEFVFHIPALVMLFALLAGLAAPGAEDAKGEESAEERARGAAGGKILEFTHGQRSI